MGKKENWPLEIPILCDREMDGAFLFITPLPPIFVSYAETTLREFCRACSPFACFYWGCQCLRVVGSLGALRALYPVGAEAMDMDFTRALLERAGAFPLAV